MSSEAARPCSGAHMGSTQPPCNAWEGEFPGADVCSPPQPFPSVTADSRRLGNDRGRAARRGAEGKAPAGSDATGLGSG